MIYASVDLGGTNIACGIAASEGVFVAERTIPTLAHEGPESVLKRIAELVTNLAAGRTMSGLGLGVPGLADLTQGRTLFLPNMPTQWREVEVCRRLSDSLGCPVALLNDARMATLGEHTYGHGRDVRSMVFFTIGTGIGGGVVIDGKLRLGAYGGAGELGHQTIEPDGPLCGCGSRGCLETLASGPALAGEGVRLLRSGLAPRLQEFTDGDAGRVTPRSMAEAARDGDAYVQEAIQRVARYLGIGIANVVTALHPELVVLGGGVAALDDLLLDPVREELKSRVRMFPLDGVRVLRSALGDRAGLFGGIALAASRAKGVSA